MNLTKKIKKRIESCICLAIVGDTISFCMAISKYNLQFKQQYEKDKIDFIQKLINENKLNITGWIHSYYSIWLFAKPRKSKYVNIIKDSNDSNKQIDLNFNEKNIKRQDKFILIIKFIKDNYKDKELIQKKIIPNELSQKINDHKKFKSNRNQFIDRYYFKSYVDKNLYKIVKNKCILTPTDDIILYGIRVGVTYLDKKDFTKRDIYIISEIKEYFKNPYTYMSIILLSTLITNIIHNNNLTEAILKSNEYIQTNYKKYIKINPFCKELQKFINKTMNIKKNMITPIYNIKFKKLNALTTILIAINSLYKYNDNWTLLLLESGCKYQTNPASCAIACAIYGLMNGYKNVPKEQYTNIENYSKFIKMFNKNDYIYYNYVNK